ncbi:hypothetical protein [Streptomyces alboflavus]|uniref:hypothetical protein n=1 Tax=Streptomyces alboflavus TaxID=67267 RepID=UPI00368BBFD3
MHGLELHPSLDVLRGDFRPVVFAVARALATLMHREHGTVTRLAEEIRRHAETLSGLTISTHQYRRALACIKQAGAIVTVQTPAGPGFRGATGRIPMYALTVHPHVDEQLPCRTPRGRGSTCSERVRARAMRACLALGLPYAEPEQPCSCPVHLAECPSYNTHVEGCEAGSVDVSAHLSSWSRRDQEVSPLPPTGRHAKRANPSSTTCGSASAPATGDKISNNNGPGSRLAAKHPEAARLAASLADHTLFAPLSHRARIRALREVAERGWTADDVRRALGTRPDGTHWTFENRAKVPSRLIAWRLSHWRTADGTLRPSMAHERAQAEWRRALAEREAGQDRRLARLTAAAPNDAYEVARLREKCSRDERAAALRRTPAPALTRDQLDAERATGRAAAIRATITTPTTDRTPAPARDQLDAARATGHGAATRAALRAARDQARYAPTR